MKHVKLQAKYIRYWGEAETAMLVSSLAAAGTSAAANGGNFFWARKQNFRHNEKAADNAQRRAISNYLNYETPTAKRRQLESAGLSAGLMYGNGTAAGQGVGTAAQSEGAQGLGAPTIAANDLNIERQMAEIENIKADTEKKNAETEGQSLENGWVNEKESALVKSILADVENTDADTEMKSILTALKNVELTYAPKEHEQGLAKGDIEIEQGMQEVSQNIEIIHKLKRENKIGDETYKQTITLVGATLANITADTKLKYANEWKAYTDAYRNEVLNEKDQEGIKQMWQEIDDKWHLGLDANDIKLLSIGHGIGGLTITNINKIGEKNGRTLRPNALGGSRKPTYTSSLPSFEEYYKNHRR